MSATMLRCKKSRVLIGNLLERFDFYSFFETGFGFFVFWFILVVILMGRVWFLRKCVKGGELEYGCNIPLKL
jgi:hypothetical protein